MRQIWANRIFCLETSATPNVCNTKRSRSLSALVSSDLVGVCGLSALGEQVSEAGRPKLRLRKQGAGAHLFTKGGKGCRRLPERKRRGRRARCSRWATSERLLTLVSDYAIVWCCGRFQAKYPVSPDLGKSDACADSVHQALFFPLPLIKKKEPGYEARNLAS